MASTTDACCCRAATCSAVDPWDTISHLRHTHNSYVSMLVHVQADAAAAFTCQVLDSFESVTVVLPAKRAAGTWGVCRDIAWHGTICAKRSCAQLVGWLAVQPKLLTCRNCQCRPAASACHWHWWTSAACEQCAHDHSRRHNGGH